MSHNLPLSSHLILGDVRKDLNKPLDNSVFVCPSYQVGVTDVMTVVCEQKGSRL